MQSWKWLVALIAALVVALVWALAPRKRSRAGRRGEGYLIHPYTDLDSPGERGSPYALMEASCGSGAQSGRRRAQ